MRHDVIFVGLGSHTLHFSGVKYYEVCTILQ